MLYKAKAQNGVQSTERGVVYMIYHKVVYTVYYIQWCTQYTTYSGVHGIPYTVVYFSVTVHSNSG